MRRKKRRKWGRWLLILLIALLLASIPRIHIPSQSAREPPRPTATPAPRTEAKTTQSVVMKSHAQIMREYNLSPLLPTMKPIMKPIHAAAPVSTNATTYSASPVGKHIGDTLMMIAVFMLTLMTGSAAPIPLY